MPRPEKVDISRAISESSHRKAFCCASRTCCEKSITISQSPESLVHAWRTALSVTMLAGPSFGQTSEHSCLWRTQKALSYRPFHKQAFGSQRHAIHEQRFRTGIWQRTPILGGPVRRSGRPFPQQLKGCTTVISNAASSDAPLGLNGPDNISPPSVESAYARFIASIQNAIASTRLQATAFANPKFLPMVTL
jgi:hypothetical protein